MDSDASMDKPLGRLRMRLADPPVIGEGTIVQSQTPPCAVSLLSSHVWILNPSQLLLRCPCLSLQSSAEPHVPL